MYVHVCIKICIYTFGTHVHMYINKHTHCRAMRANLSPLASPRMGPGRQEFLKSHLATKSTTENVYRADLREIPVENLKHQLASNTIIGWLRLVGSLKLWVSFSKEPYQRDCILQKRAMILRSLLIVATSYEK